MMFVHFKESNYTYTQEEVDAICKSIVCNDVIRYEIYWSFFKWDTVDSQGNPIYDKRPLLILGETEMEKETRGKIRLVPAYSALEITSSEKLLGNTNRHRIVDKKPTGLESKKYSEINFSSLKTVEKRWLRMYSGSLSAADARAIEPTLRNLGW